MTARQFLSRAFWLNKRIDSDIREMDELKQLVTGIGSSEIRERVQTSPSSDAPFVRSIEKIMMLEAKIDEEIDVYVDLKTEIRSVIDQVKDEKLQLVLRYRYIHFCKWEEIAESMGVTLRWAYILHQRALDEISEIISEKCG